MNWADTAGAKTGRILPTGQAVDHLWLENGTDVEATICDVGAAHPVAPV